MTVKPENLPLMILDGSSSLFAHVCSLQSNGRTSQPEVPKRLEREDIHSERPDERIPRRTDLVPPRFGIHV